MCEFCQEVTWGRVLGIEWKVKSKFHFTERWWKGFINKKAFELCLEVPKRGCLLFLFFLIRHLLSSQSLQEFKLFLPRLTSMNLISLLKKLIKKENHMSPPKYHRII